MIQLENINKSFDGRTLYNNLNLTIEDGDFVCFTGPSGCGKTTLLNMIGGLEKPDSGTIIVNGKNLGRKKDLFRFFRDDVGFVFQNFALVEKKTVRENLAMIAPGSRDKCTPEEALAFVGLSDAIDRKVYKLSGGEQQRIALARLLIKKCSLVLADEPTGSLDEKNADMVGSLLTELNKMGKTVVMVTHSEKMSKIAKRIIELER